MSARNEALLDMVERAAVALAKSHGLNFHQVCGFEVDPVHGDCNSSTCVAAWNEDHDAALCRDQYRKDARTVLATLLVPVAQTALSIDVDAREVEGTRESIATCATMLESMGATIFPPNEQGQHHFARVMMDATAAEIRAFLSTAEASS